MNFDQRRMEQL